MRVDVDAGLDAGHREDLAELRLRLYRPRPPAHAVEEYLAALRDCAPAPTPVDAPRTARTRRIGAPASRRLRVAGALLGLAACGVLAGLAGIDAGTGSVPPAAAPPALAVPEVPGASLGGMTDGGGRIGLFDAQGRAVVVSLLCVGDGVLTVRMTGSPATVLTCQRGGPALAMLGSSGPQERVLIRVEGPAAVRWSLSVGAVGPA